MKNLMLIDGTNLVNRIHWFSKSRKKGRPYRGDDPLIIVKEFVDKLITLDQKYPACLRLVIWNSEGGAHERRLIADEAEAKGLMRCPYRSQLRTISEKNLDAINTQTGHLKVDILPNLGVMRYENSAFETYDIVFSYVFKYKSGKSIIISSNKDMFHSLRLSDNVIIDTLRDDVVWDRQSFEDEYLFPCEYYTVFCGLVGDGTYSVPGVKNCGEGRAQALIDRYGDFDKIYDGLSKETRKLYYHEKEILKNPDVYRVSYDLKKPLLMHSLPDIQIDPKHEDGVKELLIKWGMTEKIKHAWRLCG